MRAAAALLTLVLVGCGAGNGDGLDQDGNPPGFSSASSGGGGGGFLLPPVPGLQPTLDSIQTNVFSVDCAVSGCHGGASAQRGLQLDPGFSYGNLVNVPSAQDPSQTRIVPGDPDHSLIVHKLEGTQTVGDRMPQGGPYLPQSTIDRIREWIQNGAPQ